MHSTGIALNLAQVARWGRAIKAAAEAGRPFPELPHGPLDAEQRLVDAAVALAYRTRRNMRAFEAAASLHVMAAMSCERNPDPDAAQFGADAGLLLPTALAMLRRVEGAGGSVGTDDEELATDLRREAARTALRLDIDCLFDGSVNGRYAATAAR